MNQDFLNKIFNYLSPPGNGVFTVHTAKENKDLIHKKIYNTTDPDLVIKKWKDSFALLDQSTKACLLGVTMDTGGGIQRGANWGPLFIRSVLELDQYFDFGDVKTIPHLLHDKYLNEKTIKNCQKSIYNNSENLPVSALSITEDFCKNFYSEFMDKTLIGLGGDHSVSYALVKPWIIAKRKAGKKVAIIHFDAHTDLMSERLGIDICFGSWAYHMLELLEKPEHLIQFGIRSSGKPKEFWESSLGVKQYWAAEIRENIQEVLDQTMAFLKKEDIDEVYISFDIDALDSKYASATGTPEPGGLEPHQCSVIIKKIGSAFKVSGADLVEVAPFVRSSSESELAPEPDTTLLSSQIIMNNLTEVIEAWQ
jgi:agmatinase